MDPFSAQLNELLVSTYRSISKVEELMLRSMSQDNLSIGEMHMLESIGRDREAGLNITDIAQELDITLPSVTTAIKKLEKKGYVTKDRHQQDGRMVCVRLTDRGLRAEIAHRYFHRQMVRTVAKSISDEEKQVLLSVLSNLNEFFRRQVDELDRPTASEPKGDDAD